jgi:hypothetical protein
VCNAGERETEQDFAIAWLRLRSANIDAPDADIHAGGGQELRDGLILNFEINIDPRVDSLFRHACSRWK